MAIYSVNVSTPSAGAGAKSDYIQREGKYEGKKRRITLLGKWKLAVMGDLSS